MKEFDQMEEQENFDIVYFSSDNVFVTLKLLKC